MSEGKTTQAPFDIIKPDTLILAVRVKESRNSTPQAQNILHKYGLKEINNAVFLKSDADTIKSLNQIKNYITFGYPTKAIVNELVKKRAYLNKKEKRLAITDNNLIEELLGEYGIICLEDIIDSLIHCNKEDSHF